MKFEEEILPRLETIKGLLIEINELHNDIFYCRNSLVRLEETNYLISNIYDSFLVRYNGLAWTALIIKLWPIYKAKEFYSIRKCLNILINNHKNSNWKDRLSLTELQGLSAKLEQSPLAEAISSLDEIRDEHLAHIDNKRRQEALISYEQVDVLVCNAIEITNVLFNRLTGYTNDYGKNPFVSLNWIYQQLDTEKSE